MMRLVSFSSTDSTDGEVSHKVDVIQTLEKAELSSTSRSDQGCSPKRKMTHTASRHGTSAKRMRAYRARHQFTAVNMKQADILMLKNIQQDQALSNMADTISHVIQVYLTMKSVE